MDPSLPEVVRHCRLIFTAGREPQEVEEILYHTFVLYAGVVMGGGCGRVVCTNLRVRPIPLLTYLLGKSKIKRIFRDFPGSSSNC